MSSLTETVRFKWDSGFGRMLAIAPTWHFLPGALMLPAAAFVCWFFYFFRGVSNPCGDLLFTVVPFLLCYCLSV